MIKQIKKIKDITVFKDFYWNSSIPEFKKYNAFYGWNASGKTTITRIFSALEKGEIGKLKMADNSECVWRDDNDQELLLKKNKIPDLFKNRIRVFNEDFVKENLNWEEGTASKIMILGEEQIEKKKKLDKILRGLEKKEKNKSLTEKDKDKKEKDKKRFLEKIRAEVIDNLRAVADVTPKSGRATDYKNYTVVDVENILKEVKSPSSDLEEKITHLRKALQDKEAKSIINEKTIDLGWFEDVNNKVNEISKTIIPKEGLKLSELQVGEELKEWLRVGYEIHKDKETPITCEFCKNIISEERLKELAQYFNEILRNLYNNIDQVIEIVSRNKLPELGLQKELFYSEFHNEYLELIDSFNSTVNTIRKELDNLKDKLAEKKNNPSQEIAFDLNTIIKTKKELEDIVSKINELIRKNNEKTNLFKDKRQESAHKLEEAIISKYKPDYDEKEKELSEIQNDINLLSTEIQKLIESQRELEQKLKQHHFAAEEFNKLLKSFMGRSEIVLETVDEGYKIKRNGEIASNLSEGERNAIAFIFFLTKLKEDNYDAQNGVIVIDDPISSFDSQYLYGAFGFIKEKVKEINPKQVFIFTHNFPFFRLIRDWMRYEKNNFSFYMIKSKFRSNERYSVIEELDKLLKEHNSEYTYLFKLVFYRSKTSESDLEKDYIFPNAIRKLLENYLSFKVPTGGISIHRKFETLCEDYPEKCRPEMRTRIESFTQDQSHPLYQDSPTDFDERLMGEIQAVCSAIIELIEITDEKHYNHLLEECGLSNAT